MCITDVVSVKIDAFDDCRHAWSVVTVADRQTRGVVDRTEDLCNLVFSAVSPLKQLLLLQSTTIFNLLD